jgi:hypothetical protein
MKKLVLLCVLTAAASACGNLPTETAASAPLDARADGGQTMGGGLYTPQTCKNGEGETVPCP